MLINCVILNRLYELFGIWTASADSSIGAYVYVFWLPCFKTHDEIWYSKWMIVCAYGAWEVLCFIYNRFNDQDQSNIDNEYTKSIASICYYVFSLFFFSCSNFHRLFFCTSFCIEFMSADDEVNNKFDKNYKRNPMKKKYIWNDDYDDYRIIGWTWAHMKTHEEFSTHTKIQ